jgi:hypothetical protein
MKNPVMSAWLSWANRAASLWTAAATSATRRNQSAFAKAMTQPPKPAKAGARKRKPARR